MKPIDIQITKAKIKGFTCTLHDDFPSITAIIGLSTENNKEITDFTIGSDSWRDDSFEIPAKMIQPLLKIAEQLEEITTLKCSAALALLKEPTGLPF